MTENKKIAWIEYNEFKEYLADDFQEKCEELFGKYVEDDCVNIEYWYVNVKGDKIGLRWRICDTEKSYLKKYNGSSPFAMWWCQIDEGE